MNPRRLSRTAAAVISLLSLFASAHAQETGAPKVEVGVHHASLALDLPDVPGFWENTAGVGARVTYNLNDYFAVEAEGNFFPTGTTAGNGNLLTGGRVQQMQFGAKVGKRWNRFGLFAKARPGFVSFDSTNALSEVTTGGTTRVVVNSERKTHFSMDVGGVLEFYPSRRVLVRFDAGDTIIRYGDYVGFVPNNLVPFRVTIGPREGVTRHNFQFNGGVGFRFGGGDEADLPPAFAAGDDVRRFELAALFSSLALTLDPGRNSDAFANSDNGSQVELGAGARFGVNATRNLAFEAEGVIYARERVGFDNTAGGWPAQFQAGVKYGRRSERYGLFAKARPGFVSFSGVTVQTGTQKFGEFVLPIFDQRRRTYFSMDVGGVLELYPSERVFTRFDFGDTMIRYPGGRVRLVFPLAPNAPTIPGETSHNFQFIAGLGFRF